MFSYRQLVHKGVKVEGRGKSEKIRLRPKGIFFRREEASGKIPLQRGTIPLQHVKASWPSLEEYGDPIRYFHALLL
jgi:hypothetical protein